MKQLKSKDLKKMSITDLVNLANQYATRLQWLHSTGKAEEDIETYKRVALELYHISQIIEQKELNKPRNKYSYGKK